jgi:hypothetical protein
MGRGRSARWSPLILALLPCAFIAAEGGALAGPTAPDAGRQLPSAADGGLPPRALACLSTWYAGEVTWDADGGFGLRLPTGLVLPWQSGSGIADAGPEDSEVAATLSDVFEPPYMAGPIVRLDAADAGQIRDPGRVRLEQLFRATYGMSAEEVSSSLTKVRFFGLRYPFHQRAAGALARVVARLEPQLAQTPRLRPFLKAIGGTWHYRRISRSKNLSTHAWGIAIDLNVDRAHYWRWQRRGEPLKWNNQVPQEIVDAFEAEGFIWGGRWLHYDTMHFEFRPELLSPLCR